MKKKKTKRLTALDKYLRTLPLETVRLLLVRAKAGRLVYVDTCKCLLGVAGGGTDDGYYAELDSGKLAEAAEHQYCHMDGSAPTREERDRHRNKNMIPFLAADLKRRKAKATA